jgi:hypothetical protein
MTPYSCLELGTQLAIARGHGLYLLHAAAGKDVENKFGSCFQWGNELFESQVLSIGKGAINPQCRIGTLATNPIFPFQTAL